MILRLVVYYLKPDGHPDIFWTATYLRKLFFFSYMSNPGQKPAGQQRLAEKLLYLSPSTQASITRVRVRVVSCFGA